MDQLAALLDGPRAHGAFLLRSLLDPPWSLRIQDEAPLSVIAQVRGESWIRFDDGEPVRLEPGQVAIARGPEPYTVADHPGTKPQVVIHPGQHCTTLDGEILYQTLDQGLRTWGNSADGGTMLLTGTYNLEGEVSRRLFEAQSWAGFRVSMASWSAACPAGSGEHFILDRPAGWPSQGRNRSCTAAEDVGAGCPQQLLDTSPAIADLAKWFAALPRWEVDQFWVAAFRALTTPRP
ncbi:AraC family transcriptional regulator [Nonomuraea diastatica]|uniref:AraC family transcriptional regulator n=1 Tax=Nonomuraea diastatica TaxID=1848329 RepID=A0A4R4WAE0_9ACTN|nr:cupin domain-containing protein [Nonomuraea diastatica]TDD13153.1 AraC family transcriptional regulator [Nonomuraea diastatica]